MFAENLALNEYKERPVMKEVKLRLISLKEKGVRV
jgi:hypothetical protein